MSTLTFLAAGLTLGLTAAAWFGSRLGRGLPNRLHQLTPAATTTPADARGITLQTLIVTAVLVLMAVAAGVVIVALTGSSSDDLEESGTDVDARCTSVEIYDPAIAAQNELGIHGGTKFHGSAIGCIPVCIVTSNSIPTDSKITADILGFSRRSSDPPGPVEIITLEIYFQSGLANLANAAARGTETQFPFLLASGEVENGTVELHIALDADAGDDPTLIEVVQENYERPVTDSGLTTVPVAVDSRIDRIAVAPNQNQCLAYDSAGEPILA